MADVNDVDKLCATGRYTEAFDLCDGNEALSTAHLQKRHEVVASVRVVDQFFQKLGWDNYENKSFSVDGSNLAKDAKQSLSDAWSSASNGKRGLSVMSMIATATLQNEDAGLQFARQSNESTALAVALHLVSEQMIAHGDESSAIQMLEESIQTLPYLSQSHRDLARALLSQNRPEDAINHIEMAALLDEEPSYTIDKMSVEPVRVGRLNADFDLYAESKNRIFAIPNHSVNVSLLDGRPYYYLNVPLQLPLLRLGYRALRKVWRMYLSWKARTPSETAAASTADNQAQSPAIEKKHSANLVRNTPEGFGTSPLKHVVLGTIKSLPPPFDQKALDLARIARAKVGVWVFSGRVKGYPVPSAWRFTHAQEVLDAVATLRKDAALKQ